MLAPPRMQQSTHKISENAVVKCVCVLKFLFRFKTVSYSLSNVFHFDFFIHTLFDEPVLQIPCKHLGISLIDPAKRRRARNAKHWGEPQQNEKHKALHTSCGCLKRFPKKGALRTPQGSRLLRRCTLCCFRLPTMNEEVAFYIKDEGTEGTHLPKSFSSLAFHFTARNGFCLIDATCVLRDLRICVLR